MTITPTAYTVLDAARDRIARTFDEFDNVIVAFSGGKDSGVMLNLVAEHLRNRTDGRRATLMHLDYEAQYTDTTEYVDWAMTSFLDVMVPVRACLPVSAGCAVSMYQRSWQPWDPVLEGIWAREMPDHEGVINTENVVQLEDFPEYDRVDDYAFQARLGRWLHHRSGAQRTAVLVGIRQDESLHRYAALNRESQATMYDGLRWTTRIFKGVYNAYPIHDWTVEDVWAANAMFRWEYNHLYDVFHMAGLKPAQMRVASPFIGENTDGLKLYRVVEPEMWSKLVGRVNGANFAGIYGGTSAMAARTVKLPEGHTWQTYAQFLLSTLPDETRENYLKKFSTSVKYWTEKGGALRVETVDELRDMGVDVDFLGTPTTKRTYKTPHEVVRFKEYPDDLPEISDFAAVPTWKRFVVTILKNDHTMSYMGFGRTKEQTARRNDAIAKYKSIL